MEPTNIFLDEDYKKKTLDELGKESLLNFDFFELYKNNEKPIKNKPLLPSKDNKTMSDKFNQAIKNPFSLYPERDGMILGIETRLSENSLPNLMNLKNIPDDRKIRLLDIGITRKKRDYPEHLSLEEINEIEKTIRYWARGYKSSLGSMTLGSPISFFKDEHILGHTMKEKQFKSDNNETVLPDLSQSVIKTFNNELLIYNYESLSSQDSYRDFINRFPEMKTEYINKINDNQKLITNSIFELLNKDFDVNIIYVEKGVGVIKYLNDYYKNSCYIQLLRNADIEELNIFTLKKVICLDCTAIKEPHLILKNKFENKKLILIVDINNFSIINKYKKELEDDIDLSVLPTEEEFKKSAWELKDKLGIKITAALNQMAVQYGYNSFNAIKPYLNKNKVTNKDRNHKMKMNLSYNQIIENIEILERNSKEYNDHRFSRNKERFIREDTIKNNDELVKLCNDAITNVTGTKTEYKNFKDIDLKVLEAAFLKVFDYTIKLGGINTNYNIIKSIRVDDKVNPNDNDYFVFEFNKDYNSDLLNESERLVQFSKEINKELISDSGKTIDTVIKLLFEKYKLRRGYPFEKVELDELSHKVEIELENKIKVCYIGTFDKFIINKGAYQITNILINDIELPLI